MPPSNAGLGNMHFVKDIFISDIYYQQFGDIYQLDEYLAIGFILSKSGDLEGVFGPSRRMAWGIVVFYNIHLY